MTSETQDDMTGAACRNSARRVPIMEVLAQCDRFFNANDPAGLGDFLRLWLSRAREWGDESGELTILSELMGHYRMQRCEEPALAAVQDGLVLMKRLNAYGTAGGGTVLINAATALQSFGYITQALEQYQAAWRCYRSALEPGDMRLAGLFNNMAGAYAADGDFLQSEKYYLQALEILKQHSNLMDMAVTYINLAQLYDQQNEADRRINLMLDEAMKCFDDPTAVRDGYYAHTCCKCASALGMLGREDDEAELKCRSEYIYARA